MPSLSAGGLSISHEDPFDRMLIAASRATSGPGRRASSSNGVRNGARICASDGSRYEADLSPLSTVYCFPRDAAAWSRVSIDSYGLALVWTSRFEVHVDQIIGLATRVQRITASASTLP